MSAPTSKDQHRQKPQDAEVPGAVPATAPEDPEVVAALAALTSILEKESPAGKDAESGSEKPAD